MYESLVVIRLDELPSITYSSSKLSHFHLSARLTLLQLLVIQQSKQDLGPLCE
jgi:hypothetical protein